MTDDDTSAAGRWAHIERLYHRALELPPASRDEFLHRACEGDDELRGEVASLLAHDLADEEDDGLLERPAVTLVAQALADDLTQSQSGTFEPGRVIGHYRLVRHIGHGGMGEVFLADDLSLHRRVALKFLPPDLANDSHASARLVREAQSASALAHPNIVTVHSVETAGELTFIVMEYVEGETLKARLEGGPLRIADVLAIGAQVADALAAAHAVGLIHRDIKPANIIVTASGQAKVLDFGIAKRWDELHGQEPAGVPHTDLTQTLTGEIHGTVSYMSPEQARGEPLDPRADIFSLGAVLYEAATGTRPFTGPDTSSIIRAIVEAELPPSSSVSAGIPVEFDRVVGRALAKQAAERYPSASEFSAALRDVGGLGATRARRRRRHLAIAGVLVLVVIAVGAGIRFTRDADRRWAGGAASEAARLASERRYLEAFDVVSRARQFLPEDPALERIALMVSDDLSVVTTPAGARVYLTAAGEAGEAVEARRLVGTSPVTHALYARGDYLLEIEKDGFAPVRRMVSSALVRNDRAVFDPSELRRTAAFEESIGGAFRLRLDAPGPVEVHVRLVESATVPTGMVFVPGGAYRLVAADRPTSTEVHLDDYFIDRLETSNRDYREFIEAGGYDRSEFWSAIVDRATFVDRTGRPGPRSWTNQEYATGMADHPVTDITWHEASAYAAFRGTMLPTVFQWEKAARDGQFSRVLGYVMPWGLVDPADRLSLRANFLTSGTVPVDSFPFGISPVGALQMAGNVAEWCRNARPGGYTVAGGSWQDPLYLFGAYGNYPTDYAAGTIGFRTVKQVTPSVSDQGATPLENRARAAAGTPVNDSTYRTLLTHYQYDHTPLEAAVTGIQDGPDWRREQITFVGAGGDRAAAYLYLPRSATGPVPVIHYVPSDAVRYSLTVPEEVEALMTPLIRSGYAVFSVVNQGFSERPFPSTRVAPSPSSVRHRELVVSRSIDLQRGLDYLATRPEIDMNRLAAFGTSIWSYELIPFVIERRYRTVVFLSVGLSSTEGVALPEANPINFVPRMGAPTLMLSGRHDETIGYDASVAPLFELLPTPRSIRLFDGGHIPPLAAWVPVAVDWLDARLGVVRR